MQRFITVEGIEGVGKSTVVQAIAQHLQHKNISCCVTREPGGTPVAEDLRALLLAHHQERIVPATEVLLMFAARAQHVANVIQPALQVGQWVLSDRFTDASFAYQGGGRGLSVAMIEQLAQFSQDGCQPDCTILLTAPVNVALERAKQRASLDRFESETVAFFERVQQAYLQRAAQDPTRFRVIDASQPLDKVLTAVLAVIDACLATGDNA